MARTKNGSARMMPVGGIDGRRMNFCQHLIVVGGRFFYAFELKNFGWSVFCVNNRFHVGAPPLISLRALSIPMVLVEAISQGIPSLRLADTPRNRHRTCVPIRFRSQHPEVALAPPFRGLCYTTR